MQHIYIHIPFCKSLCPYCDFYTILNKPELQEIYTAALIKELDFFRTSLTEPVASIYIGGGTPSVLEVKYLQRLFKTLQSLNWSSNIEITIEVNPLTVSAEKFSQYFALGINRISLGTQSFNDDELKTLGRQHRKDDNYFAYETALKAGFTNINLDLLIGIPGQTTESLKQSLEQIELLEPQHISPYVLTYYEDTVYTKMVASGRIIPAGNELEADLFDLAADFLESKKYKRYEISNFAKSGFHSRHNLNTWCYGEYLGIGCAAHSFFDLKRRANPADFQQYLTMTENSDWLGNQEIVSVNEQISEYIMLALRTTEGLDLQLFKKRFNKDFRECFSDNIKKYLNYNLVEISGDKLFLTKRGMDLFNNVVADFLVT